MDTRYCLDTSAFITAWNIQYPPTVFPSLWRQLGQKKEKIVVIHPVLQELKGKKDAVLDWVLAQSFGTKELSQEMEQAALLLEGAYRIRTSPKGVNSVDIRLITWAKHTESTVVTCEAWQPQPPKRLSNYKIPAVCKREDVPCITFVALLENLSISM